MWIKCGVNLRMQPPLKRFYSIAILFYRVFETDPRIEIEIFYLSSFFFSRKIMMNLFHSQSNMQLLRTLL